MFKNFKYSLLVLTVYSGDVYMYVICCWEGETQLSEVSVSEVPVYGISVPEVPVYDISVSEVPVYGISVSEVVVPEEPIAEIPDEVPMSEV